MRVLVLAIALAGCYDPGVEDCQFTCGMPGMACPDGSECRNGFCRTSDALTCQNDPCAGAPEPPPNCSEKFPLLETNGCGVVCPSTLDPPMVQAACGPNWRAGILDNRAELDRVPVTMGKHWVGAQRVSTQFQWFSGAPVEASSWDSGFPNLTGSACVYMEGSRHRLRNDRPCDEDQPYICTYPPTN